ncbi:SUF system NifU family Fe-S cluster assembly protein [Candidatus Peregrinibacteria bacterium]|nr:SUF system NifU family Fe-S cluster assembly protein [Candidatus Peregrinibacteria bacterium]
MDIYSEIILDYFKNPRNRGKLPRATIQAQEYNPLCGDKITIYLLLDKNGKIKKAAFNGEGCAISQASASMLTEKIIGKTIPQITKITNEEIIKMLHITISPARIKCAILGLITAKKAAITHKYAKN